MSNTYFRFKQFTVHQEACAMKVTTDACLFGAWCAEQISQLWVTNLHILDIGTGTGLLSLMVAQKNSTAHIDAVEVEKEAAGQADTNCRQSPFHQQIQVLSKDVLSYVPFKKYDVILCNPPFYEGELSSPNYSINQARHSTALSVDQLLSYIKQYLQPSGRFYLLLPYKRKSEVQALLIQKQLSIYNIVSVAQSVQHSYFRIMLEGGFNKSVQPVEQSIAITDAQRHYTPAFVDLLKDYYLKL